jgi:hypothetical protein
MVFGFEPLAFAKTLRFLCDLCVSAVNSGLLMDSKIRFTAETQRTQRKRRDELAAASFSLRLVLLSEVLEQSAFQGV